MCEVKGTTGGSEEQFHTLFTEEQILNSRASCPLKPVHII